MTFLFTPRHKPSVIHYEGRMTERRGRHLVVEEKKGRKVGKGTGQGIETVGSGTWENLPQKFVSDVHVNEGSRSLDSTL